MNGTVSGRRMHFLCGSSPQNLVRVLWRYGGVSASSWKRLALVACAAVGFAPSAAIEQLLYSRRLSRIKIEHPPLFVIGHWRSGTSHLHNILSRDPQLGYLSLLQAAVPWNMLGLLGFVRWVLRRSLPQDRLVDALPFKPDTPAEEAIALANMCPYSSWHAFYFPSRIDQIVTEGILLEDKHGRAQKEWQRNYRHLLKQVTLLNGGRRLVLKDPANTARVKALLKIYPDAKFIHICRNPFEVFVSMRHLLKTLIPELSLQDCAELPLDGHVLDIYQRLMQSYLQQRSLLAEDQLVEIRFEELEKEPLLCLEEIYCKLKLPGWQEAEPHFAEYLESQADYQRNSFELKPREIELVQQHWQFALEEWGYNLPVEAAHA